MRAGRLLCCITALAAFVAFAAPAHADEYNKLTYLTFSAPVQLPGTTLAAGTYMFKLADTMAERHIVQVFDKDGGKLYATLLAIPDYRIDAPDKNVVMFGERPAGTPQAVKAWWYPGDTTGEEFVYPRAQAMKLARANHESVLSSNEGIADRGKMKSAHVGRVNERGETAENTAPAAASAATTTADHKTATGTSGSKMPTTTDRASKSTASTTTANESNNPSTTSAANSRRHLPRTASPLGLIELLSGAAFVGAAATRQLRRRLADHASA